jgi:uncharacterized protein YecE (DUF72 family)
VAVAVARKSLPDLRIFLFSLAGVQRVRVGTSGFSYREWKGRFYPKDLAASKMLVYYASKLDAVEINNTFYRRPDPKQLAAWAASVPASFRFAFKASRYFSAGPGLRDARRPLAELFALLDAVKGALGPLLVQLPPHLRKDLALLRGFLGAIPPGRRVALDLRDPSWRADDVRDAMRAAGVAWCVTESDDEPLDLVTTAPWTYVRLRKSRYDARALGAFAARLRAAGATDGWVFFKHDDRGSAAKHALTLRGLL